MVIVVVTSFWVGYRPLRFLWNWNDWKEMAQRTSFSNDRQRGFERQKHHISSPHPYSHTSFTVSELFIPHVVANFESSTISRALLLTSSSVSPSFITGTTPFYRNNCSDRYKLNFIPGQSCGPDAQVICKSQCRGCFPFVKSLSPF